jgi:hypothetical protein
MKKLGELPPLVATLDRTATLLWREVVPTADARVLAGRQEPNEAQTGYGAGVTGRQISQLNQGKFRVLTTQ